MKWRSSRQADGRNEWQIHALELGRGLPLKGRRQVLRVAAIKVKGDNYAGVVGNPSFHRGLFRADAVGSPALRGADLNGAIVCRVPAQTNSRGGIEDDEFRRHE